MHTFFLWLTEFDTTFKKIYMNSNNTKDLRFQNQKIEYH